MSREKFIETARGYLGYQARPGNITDFGGLTGYQGLPWDGSFIDVVAREAGVSLPACVYTPSGLAEFIRIRRWRAKPQPGDIVFFTWSTGETFGMPHIGIVTDVTDWNKLGKFRTIEAQVNSGLPKAQQIADGVFERTRYKYEVLGFGRPIFNKGLVGSLNIAGGRFLNKGLVGASEIAGGSKTTIQLLHVRPGLRTKAIERVQLALALKVGLANAKQGMFDNQTQAAYARWQRLIGLVGSDARGIPTESCLSRLGRETGYFEISS